MRCRATLGRPGPMIVRIDARMPQLATGVELADVRAELTAKPSHIDRWGVPAALLGAYGGGLAALAILK